MLKKIGLISIFLILPACATEEKIPLLSEVVAAHQELKIEIPKYNPFKVTGLLSVECKEGICTMSEDDFRTSQNDKWNLKQVYKLNYLKDVVRVKAFNTLVDAHAHSELSIAKKRAVIVHLESELRNERVYNSLKTWLERLLFISGVVVFGSL